MIRYHFDLYPRDDPRDGARVVRFTKLQSAEYRGEANGTGSGRFSIRADVAEAQLIDPRGLQYVRVVREDTVAVTEAVVGGFWLETGDFTLLDEQGTRLLSFGGAGTLAYLSRAVMWSHTYISPIFPGQDPIGGTWNLWNQSTVFANGNFLGAMLWRVLYEAQHNTPGVHKHGDTPAGETVSDTHDDDRPAIAIADMVFDFDQFEDSNGNDWTISSGEFKAQVGENVLAVVKRLMEAGLYVTMDPDTFELKAYQAATHRRDRTGGAWGASVVRFQAPTGEDITTGNIKSDAKRAIHAYIPRSVVLAGGGSDVYGIDTGTSDIAWEGFYYAEVNDVDAAENIASIQIGARDDAGDTLRIRGRLGTAVSSGYYRPFEDAWLDDLATVDTGSNQFDLDEQDFPIAAITVNLRPGGDWDVWYDLGSSYSANPSRNFQVVPVPAHNHGPNPELCRPGVVTEASRLYITGTAGTPRTADAAWAASGDMVTRQMSLTSGGTTGSGSTWDAVNQPASSIVLLQGVLTLSDAGLLAAVQAGGPFRAQFRIGIRHGIGINESVAREYLEGCVRVYRPGTASFIGTALDVGDATGTVYAENDTAGTVENRSMVGTMAAVPGAAATDILVVEIGTKHDAPTTGGAGGRVYWDSGAASDLPEDDTTQTHLNSWIDIGGGTSSGDLPLDTVAQGEQSVGTSIRAARCDHEHAHGLLSADGVHYHDASDIDGLAENPPVIEGFVLTTLGGQHDLSTVAASGSAETLDLADGNVHDVTLTDDCAFTFTGGTSGVECRFRLLMRQDGTGSHVPTFPVSVVWPDDTEPTWSTDPDAVDIIEFTSVDGGTTWFGDAGGSSGGADPTLRWEAVTNGEDVFVWEGDDLVHEWKAY
jgi:hypothetical protein